MEEAGRRRNPHDVAYPRAFYGCLVFGPPFKKPGTLKSNEHANAINGQVVFHPTRARLPRKDGSLHLPAPGS
eukprot:11185599-Lingulodinium_polyedra.AAC.1